MKPLWILQILSAILVLGHSLIQNEVRISSRNQSSTTFGETRIWVRDLGRDSSHSKALGPLFRNGDTRIEDLVQLLSDPENEVRLGAQRIIRYLGNKRGMQTLTELWEAKKIREFTGAVPLPVWAIDYEFSRSVRDKRQFRYAFALDGSVRAKEELSRLPDNGPLPTGAWLGAVDCSKLKTPDKYDECLAERVQDNSPWTLADKEDISVRVLAHTAKGDKALAVLIIGETFTEGFYVVLERSSNREKPDWRFFSITPAWVS